MPLIRNRLIVPVDSDRKGFAAAIASRPELNRFVNIYSAAMWGEFEDEPLCVSSLLAALGLYALALVAKSLDTTLCAWVPIGLHWIWHILGGAAAGVALHGVWQLERPPQSLGSTTEDPGGQLRG